MVVDKLVVDFSHTGKFSKTITHSSAISLLTQGKWASLFKGDGVEFENFRSYSYSDDASRIDWPTSLRSDELLIKEFVEYKEHNVFFVLDVSDSMLFTTTKQFKAEYGAELVYALATSAIQAGDSVGLALFNDGLVSVLPPTRGNDTTQKFKKILGNRQFYGGKKDFKKSILQLEKILPMNSIVVFISDFFDLGDDWHMLFSLLQSKSIISSIVLEDKRDKELPKKGIFTLKNISGDEVLRIDSKKFAKDYALESKNRSDSLRRFFYKHQISYTLVTNGEPFDVVFRSFFNSKNSFLAVSQE